MPVVLFFLLARFIIHHDEIDERFIVESLVDVATAPSGGGRIVGQVVMHELLSFADDEGMFSSAPITGGDEIDLGDLGDLALDQLPVLQQRPLPGVRDDLLTPAESRERRHRLRAQQHAERAADEADMPKPRTLPGVRDDLPTPAETRDRHHRRVQEHAAERDEVAKPIHKPQAAPFGARRSVRK